MGLAKRRSEERLCLRFGNFYMSRIGKKVIAIPSNTEVIVSEGHVAVKGPLGTLSRPLAKEVEVSISPDGVSVSQKEENLEARALWGTYASHLTNMIRGVNSTFEKKLVLEGIGYKVDVKGDTLVMALGFSHPVEVLIPSGIKVGIEKNTITISGIEKDLVGEFTAKIRALKKPEPYKGKGLRYFDEVIKIKQGKKSV